MHLVLLQVGLAAQSLSTRLLVGARLVQLSKHRLLGLRVLHVRPLPLHLRIAATPPLRRTAALQACSPMQRSPAEASQQNPPQPYSQLAGAF